MKRLSQKFRKIFLVLRFGLGFGVVMKIITSDEIRSRKTKSETIKFLEQLEYMRYTDSIKKMSYCQIYELCHVIRHIEHLEELRKIVNPTCNRSSCTDEVIAFLLDLIKEVA